MDNAELVKKLREIPDCCCGAIGPFECGCGVDWPENHTAEAADTIERLEKELAAARKVVEAAQSIVNLGTIRSDGGLDYYGNISHIATALTAYEQEKPHA